MGDNKFVLTNIRVGKMKKFAILVLTMMMASFCPQAHAQNYGRGASAGTDDASTTGWVLGGAAVVVIAAMGAVIGVYSSNTPTTFSHT